MENNTTKSPLFSKGKLILASFLVVAIAGFGYWYFGHKKIKTVDPAYAKYIEGYTTGVISKQSAIRIELASDVKTLHSPNQAEEAELFSFSPSIKGKAYWVNARTIEFRPEENLSPGKLYDVSFKLNKVTRVEKGMDEFAFQFQVIKPSYTVEDNGLKSQNSTSLDYMKLTGAIRTADTEEPQAIEKVLQSAYPGKKLHIKWQHNAKERTSNFSIDSIKRGSSEQTLKLSLDGSSLKVDKKDSKDIKVPAIGVFKVLDVKAVQEPEEYALVQFSDPVNVAQDLNGLIGMSMLGDLRYTIDGSEVKVYAPDRLEGNYTVNINEGIENIRGKKIQKSMAANIVFENKLPSVKIPGNGTILPNSGKLAMPFEAVNLNAVDVVIIKVFENNVPQFYQNNSYNEGNELRRVGKPVVQKTIRLDGDKSVNLHKKNRFTLDIDKLLRTEPGAIYRVTIGFRKSYSIYKCDGKTSTATNGSDGESYGEGDYNDYYQKTNLDEDDEFWQRYDNYYPYNYRWSDRDNPCSESYYTKERWANRNLIASNIGLIAKRGNDNSMLVIATDILTAKPLSGIDIQLLDYQQQVLLNTKTDGDGMAKFDMKRKPFLLIAKNDKERGYLKLDDANSLPLSRFNVGGDAVQNGLKGYLYGERGVWRPGDSVFLSFILEDKAKKLPEKYPVNFELYTPQGQLYRKAVQSQSLNGFYTFHTSTESTSPTGNWTAKVKVSGATFTKTVKIETIMPNRLKINMDFGGKTTLNDQSGSYSTLSAKWLFGATAQFLKAKVDVNLRRSVTTFKDYKDYAFDDPTARFETENKTIFDGTLNDKGTAAVSTQLHSSKNAPGMLQANFMVKVFEPGGNFSIDNVSMPYHPYKSYVGIRTPEGNKMSGMLLTDQDHQINIVNVNENGQAMSGARKVQVELYKVQWRWWWDKNDETLSNFTQDKYNKLIKKEELTLNNGKGNWNVRINYPEWGRFLILVRDLEGGHTTGKTIYVDWPGWSQREQQSNPTEAAMLSFTANKEKYSVGEDVSLTIPSGKGGRGLISIENGSRVLKTYWIDTKPGQTQFKFKAEKEMAPNVFVNVTLLQPHAQTVNDLPIRMYGAIPILVEDPTTILKPVVSMASVLRPETQSSISVSESSGKAMTYTIALVDEGLLDLTRYKTPDPHSVFYAREALGVKTWDLFDYVMGAWGGDLERILSIGGDGSVNKNVNPAKANRFVPVVKVLGPFYLSKGQKQTHQFKLPQYVGSIRAMVVAGQDGAYGFAEKAVAVKKPLMLLATLPRVIGPGETFKLPVNVFAMEPQVKNVQLSIQSQNLDIAGAKSQAMTFAKIGEQMAYFDVKASDVVGVGKVKIVAKSGKETAVYDVEIDIRNPNPYMTSVNSGIVQPGATWSSSYAPLGMGGTNTGTIEVSAIPPINLTKRLNYLIQYPHGCIEQITSAGFPQLMLDRLTSLNDQQKASIDRNIKAVLNRYKNYQTSDGGMGYWPGASTSDEWGSNYAGNFMLEAMGKGYTLPPGIMDLWLKFQRNKATTWSPNSNNFYGGDITQAYRLYLLALAKKPEIAAMNRLKAFQYISPEAKWRLAAAYKLAGQSEVANAMVQGLSTEVKPYNQMGGTYGSDLRDQAMILETLTLLGQRSRAANLIPTIAAKLAQDSWYSTQTTAYSLLAIARFCGTNTGGSKTSFGYTINGASQSVNSNDYYTRLPLSFRSGNGNASIVNKGKNVLYVRMVLQGQPLIGQNNAFPENPDILQMSVNYKTLTGKVIDPSRIPQGTDFVAEVSIKNPGKQGYYEQMALTQIFPSGWEIINTRLNDNEGALSSSAATYRDIRDDRVLTYFNIREGETLNYKVLLNASYLGRYYLAPLHCEAMYNTNISATLAGKWVEVVKQ